MKDVYIKQIMPAPDNLYVIYEDGEEKWESKVVCFALWNDSEISMMEHDDDGSICEVADNIEGIIYK